ncbi:hypothetical protein GOP47_0004213 [Adiantum capillus-veneris]|uniref:Leucine-rich repeat-containing N-terminal plant-type domain-containing protein n=1 Tax=Adiantum capillus-veneris TaxID=13818 RepID=A0A9D4V740_ADICA|nr:hypothetical protein GOP47_0004213 [Adiantum capillus-veneris]
MSSMALLLPCFIFVVAAAVAGDDDANCLMGLKASFEEGGANEKLNDWKPAALASPCSNPSTSFLPGITCSSSRVISILLNSFNLAGTLSPSIANCSDLQTLDLSSNSITGPIPSSIALGFHSWPTRTPHKAEGSGCFEQQAVWPDPFVFDNPLQCKVFHVNVLVRSLDTFFRKHDNAHSQIWVKFCREFPHSARDTMAAANSFGASLYLEKSSQESS